MSDQNFPNTPHDPAAPHSAQTQPTLPLPAAQSYSPEFLAQTYQGGQPEQAAEAAPEQYPAEQQFQQTYPQPYLAAQPTAAPSQATTLGQTNTFAMLAIIFAFLSPLAGIIFGHLALGQIKRNGDAGRGIGLTGLIISYASFVFIALFLIFYIGVFVLMFGAMGAIFSDIPDVSSYDPYSYSS